MTTAMAFYYVSNVNATGSAFAPTLDAVVSTHQAGAHPDLELTIANDSDEDLKDLTITFPDGFFGSARSANTCPAVDAAAGNCPSSSELGTIDAVAKVDQSTVRVQGKLYLTDATAGGASGVSIKFPVVVGGIDMGNVIVPVDMKMGDNARHMKAVATDIPRMITDAHGTTSFHISSVTVRIEGTNYAAGEPRPVLYNAHSCDPHPFSVEATSYSGTVAPVATVAYQATGCASVANAPSLDIDVANPVVNQTTGMVASLSMPSGNSSLKSTSVVLPPLFGPEFPAFGAMGDQCPGSSAPLATSIFDPSLCPPQAVVGTAMIDTPLLPNPVNGLVYLIYKGTLPWFGVHLVAPGIDVRLLATTGMPQVDPACNPTEDVCKQQISMTFGNLPDVPATTVVMDLDGPDRTGLGGATLTGKFLNIDPGYCNPAESFRSTFTAHSGAVLRRLQSVAYSGCADEVSVGSGPDDGSVVNDNTPTLSFAAPTYSLPAFTCAVDYGVPVPCASPFTYGPLSDGQHVLQVYGVGTLPGQADTAVRNVKVDTSGPTGTSIISGPAGTTSDTTPAFGFGATDATADFECRVDAGSYSACSSGSSIGTLGNGPHTLDVRATDGANVDPVPATRTFTVATDPEPGPPTTTFVSGPNGLTADDTPTFSLNSDQSGATFECRVDEGAYQSCASPLTVSPSLTIGNHELAVRATDGFSNTGVAVVRRFTVATGFAPTLQTSLTTLAARGHPDLTATIESGAAEDLKQISVELPDGLLGSLNSADNCTVADAGAGSCGAASKIGTVHVSALIDRSDIVLDGSVYITDPLQPGDPAGLSIVVPATVGAVDLGDVIVPMRLAVRGQLRGLTAISSQIPNTLPDDDGAGPDTVTAFHLRKFVMKLKTGSGRSPLLVNPSACGSSNFAASFVGYDGSSETGSDGYTAVGCEGLSFNPTMSVTLKDISDGHVALSKKPLVTVSLAQGAGEAGMSTADVLMPSSVGIDIPALNRVPWCKNSEFLVRACPDSSIVGDISVASPLLKSPLTGTVHYLEKMAGSDGLPRLALLLRGVIDLDFTGQINLIDGRVGATFEQLPDVPLSRIDVTFKGGVDGLLKLNRDLCGGDADQVTGSALSVLNRRAALSSGVSYLRALARNRGFVREMRSFAYFDWRSSGFNRGNAKLTLRVVRSCQPTIKQLAIKLPKGLSLRARPKTAVKITTDRGRSPRLQLLQRGRSIRVNLTNKYVQNISITMRRKAFNGNRKMLRKLAGDNVRLPIVLTTRDGVKFRTVLDLKLR